MIIVDKVAGGSMFFSGYRAFLLTVDSTPVDGVLDSGCTVLWNPWLLFVGLSQSASYIQLPIREAQKRTNVECCSSCA